MDRRIAGAPENPSAVNDAVLGELQKYPHEYDWEAVAELWPSVDAMFQFYRAVDRGINPAGRHQYRHDIRRSRDFRRTFALASRYAGALGITHAQRNKFARLFSTIVDGDGDDLAAVTAAWQRTLDQKVSLVYLRQSCNTTVCPNLEHYTAVLDAHAAKLNPAYAQASARGDVGMFTVRQLAALSKTDIDPEYAIDVSRHGRQTVADIIALVAERTPWNYRNTLLREGMRGTDIARLYAAGIPLEYAVA